MRERQSNENFRKEPSGKHSRDTLLERLECYRDSDYYGFHMPGHKRNPAFGRGLPFGIDITEIEGFDDLHHAEGILKEAQALAARVWGAQESRFLVNGSTVGILSSILGCTNRGDRILVARNCHKSVHHGIGLNELDPVYVYPGFSEEMHLNTDISVDAVKAALARHPDIRAAVIVSPAYDGVISDIGGIAQAVHRAGIPLIVDEAHGAHLGFHPYFGENALAKGADLVIHSVHKTLPSMTQTALLHVQGDLVNRRKVFRYLDMLQSSSPSYVLMASIDSCTHLLQEQGEELFADYALRLQTLRQRLGGLRHLKLLETERYDPSKIVISTAGLPVSGKELYQMLLERYHLQPEMAAGTYVIAMTSLADTDEGLARLEQALFALDGELGERAREQEKSETPEMQDESDGGKGAGIGGRLPENRKIMKPSDALRRAETGAEETVPWQRSVGRISAEYAYLYPPGSPLLAPGEEVSPETAALLAAYREAGYSVEGVETPGQLRVLRAGSGPAV